jgi:serine/threonine-protein kinase
MLVGQQVGPFQIDKELGAGAMGAVYRGKYLKTGQLVAVKVMAPGLGTTNASAANRFEREANILKQLNHPNIVKLFGVGKHHGTRYYAMEYVQGESLDRVMSRRDRMSWEEVVDLGLQLCAALQHAHEAGIVHRDLKPSNLMILSDGTLKLTDFGIAKDLDVTQLTGANCTVGTAAYMSPEQCRGEPNLTYKSDLYSLGVVFYELITGRKPFNAENAMEMFMMHVNQVPERPSRLVPELPVWLDNLICQLLEKKPEHRPLDAAMVASVLGSIQEKVEAQQSAGLDAVKARGGDQRRNQRGPAGDDDKAAARALLGKKGRKKKKKGRQLVWLKAAAIVAGLAVIVGGIVLLSRPPSQQALYREAERLMKSDNPDKHDKAMEDRGPVRRYLDLYGQLDDERTRQVRQWADDYDAARWEKLIDRHVRHEKEKRGLAVEAQTPAQKLAFKAALAEHDGDREEASKLWKEVLEQNEPTGIGVVASRHLAALAGIDAEAKRLQALRAEVRKSYTEPELKGMEQRAFDAFRMAELGDRLGAKRRYEQLREAAGKDPANRFWQLLAAVQIRRLEADLKERSQDEKGRVEAVSRALADAAGSDSLLTRRLVAHEVVRLYEKNEDFAETVGKAKGMVAAVDKELGKEDKKK